MASSLLPSTCTQSLVRKRRDKGGLFKIDRRRQLILTTKPRIIYLDPETSVPTVKGEVRVRAPSPALPVDVPCRCAR